MRIAQNGSAGFDVFLYRGVGVRIDESDLAQVVFEFARRIVERLGGLGDRHVLVCRGHPVAPLGLGRVNLGLLKELLVLLCQVRGQAQGFGKSLRNGERHLLARLFEPLFALDEVQADFLAFRRAGHHGDFFGGRKCKVIFDSDLSPRFCVPLAGGAQILRFGVIDIFHETSSFDLVLCPVGIILFDFQCSVKFAPGDSLLSFSADGLRDQCEQFV